jgi:hypothetical protein
MNKHKLGKANKSINQLDANKSNSGVSDNHMAIMYKLSNMASDIADVSLEEEEEQLNNK